MLLLLVLVLLVLLVLLVVLLLVGGTESGSLMDAMSLQLVIDQVVFSLVALAANVALGPGVRGWPVGVHVLYVLAQIRRRRVAVPAVAAHGAQLIVPESRIQPGEDLNFAGCGVVLLATGADASGTSSCSLAFHRRRSYNQNVPNLNISTCFCVYYLSFIPRKETIFLTI